MKILEKVVVLLLGIIMLCACGKENLHNPSNKMHKLEKHDFQDTAHHKPLAEASLPGENNGNVSSPELLFDSFPLPVSKSLGLSGQDAILFDAAVNALSRDPTNDICIPVVGIYGSYSTQNETILLCSVQYHYFYGYSGANSPLDEGGQHRVAKAIIQENSKGEIVCTSFDLCPTGGFIHWIVEFCGPIIELKNHFLNNEPWDIIITMPTATELLSRYISSLDTDDEE